MTDKKLPRGQRATESKNRPRRNASGRRAEIAAARLGIILDSLSELATYQDTSLRVLWANKAAQASAGLSLEEMEGRFCYDIWHGRQEACAGCPLLKALQTGDSQRGEIAGRDGKTWLIHGAPQRDASGRVVGLIATATEVTAYKELEQELVRSQRRYSSIVERSNDGIVILQGGRVAFANPRMVEMTGFSLEEAIGKPFLDFVVPEYRSMVADRYQQRLSAQAAADRYEVDILHKKGTKIPVEVVASVIEHEGRLAVMGLMRDITERRQAEDFVRIVSMEWPVGVYIVQKGRFVYTNPQFQAHTGYTENELRGMDPLSLVLPEDRGTVRENAIQMLKGKRQAPYEFRVRDRKGNTRWALESVASVRYRGEQLALGNYQDITERRQAEEALRHSEEKLATMFESLPQGIIEVDPQGRIVQVNEAMLRMLGYGEKAELSGKDMTVFIAEKDMARAREDFRRRLAGFTGTVEYTFVTRDGNEFSAELAGAAFKDASGEPLGVIAISEDIRERRKTQEHLIQTDRLTTLGELVSGVAHELNNPLTSIIGFSDLLMARKDIPEDMRKDLDVIGKEAQRTSSIVRGLLSFARKRTGEKSPVDVNSAIQKVLLLRAYEQKVSNIQVITRFAQDLPWVNASEFQLQQLFMNIIINAEHFMLEAHKRGILTITTEKAGDMVRIAFADDGPGIPRENLPHIFDPFFTTKPVGKGTGLGLSICHGIVTQHGGRIYAESGPGQGATFVVELPTGDEVTNDKSEGGAR